VKLAVRREGSGPPVVCHPGGPGFAASSLTDLGGLADSFELLFLDPRGTGSTPPAQTYRQEEYVEDLEELRVELGLEQFDLLGHSHGGFVAMAYAAAHPQRVRKLVLAATAPRFAPEYRQAIDAVWDASDDPSIAAARAARDQRLSGDDLPPDEFVRLAMIELRLFFARPEGVGVIGQVFQREPPNIDALAFFNRETAPSYDVRPELPAITADTLVVTGDHDFFGELATDDIVAGIPRARSVVLTDAGHFLWVDEPGAFAAEVRRFLLQ